MEITTEEKSLLQAALLEGSEAISTWQNIPKTILSHVQELKVSIMRVFAPQKRI